MPVLNDAEQQALRDALDDEYRAWATYDRVIRDFGPERSTSRQDIRAVFGNLQRASQARHLQAFRRCANRGPGRGARRG